MGYELSKGTLFATIGDETMTLGDGIPFTEEIELSAKEHLSHLYHLNNTSSLSFEMKSSDLDLLNNLCGNPVPTGNFTMEYKLPIMIQARWHKKARIRKKWLKRFGMKPDTVKVCANAHMLEYHPGHILDEYSDDNGIWATFDNLEFEVDKQEYIWRPDQLRKGLKIEW